MNLPHPPLEDNPTAWDNWTKLAAAEIHVTQREMWALLKVGYEWFKKWRTGKRTLSQTKWNILRQNAVDLHIKIRNFPPEALKDRISFIEYSLDLQEPKTPEIDPDGEYKNPNYYNSELDYWRPRFLARTPDNWSRLEWGKAIVEYNRRWGRDKKGTLVSGMSGVHGQWMKEINLTINDAPPCSTWLHPKLQRAHMETPPPILMDEILREEWKIIKGCWQKTVLEQKWYWNAVTMDVGVPEYFRAWQRIFIFQTYQEYDKVPSLIDGRGDDEELIGVP